MHDVVYFHGRGMADALLVLATYTILGTIVVLAVSALHARRTRLLPITTGTPRAVRETSARRM